MKSAADECELAGGLTPIYKEIETMTTLAHEPQFAATSDVTEQQVTADLLPHLKRRVDRRTVKQRLSRLRSDLHARRLAYAGGLPAETQSLQRDAQAAKQAVRQLLLSRRGRRIHLAKLLKQKRKSGEPVWALVDPTMEIAGTNGQFHTDGEFGIGGKWRKIAGVGEPHAPKRAFQAVGLPPLPTRVRELAADRKIRERATWIGVLYQPESWREVDPDPALVVEWDDLPGEYYALAVWGGDRGRIMEFVD